MKRALFGLAALLFGLLPAASNQLLLKAGGNGGGPNPDSLLIVTPYNNGTLLQLNTFQDANTACNFYNTNASGAAVKECTAADAFFAGSPSTDAQLGVLRAGQSGSRARNIGATVCEVPCANLAACQALGDCAAAGGATTQLANLQAVTAGSLNWTQDGVALSATGIDLSGDASLSAVATTVQTAMDAAPPTTGAVGANLATSAIASFTCSSLQGEIGAGYLTITVAPSACVYPGGTITAPDGVTGVILGQFSGTPNGAGVYSVSSPIGINAFAPSLMTAASPGSEGYSVLTVGTIGSTDTIKSGQGLYATTPTVVNTGIYSQLIAGVTTQPSSCVGAACAGTTWVLGSAAITAASESMVTSVCRVLITYQQYYGNTLNRDRFWMEQRSTCTSGAPTHTMTYVTSNSTGAGDNLASLVGWGPQTTSPGGSPGVIPNLPYTGDWLSVQSELIGDPTSSYADTWPHWIAYQLANTAGVSSFTNWSWIWNVDAGNPNQTYTGAIRTQFATTPAYRFLDVWSYPATAYPEANYALNSPYGPPTCVPGYQQFTVASGSFVPTNDYCYNHDIILEGAGGLSTQAQNSGLAGGVGAGGANVYMVGLTGSAGAVTGPTFQVGVGGAGNVTGNRTEITSWGLYAGGSTLLYALSGGNATATASGAAGAQAAGCTISLAAGSFTAFESASTYCRAGNTGVAINATAGAGGPGGTSGASLVAIGKQGAGAAGAGGMGGGGTSSAGSGNGTGTTGGNSGTFLDGTAAGTGGAGGATPTAGGAPSGGGGGTNGTSNGGAAGANGHTDTEFATLTHPCPGGPGSGGGGSGGDKIASGTPITPAIGGNGADFGASGAGGAGVSGGTPATLAQPGTAGNGVACWIGY